MDTKRLREILIKFADDPDYYDVDKAESAMNKAIKEIQELYGEELAYKKDCRFCDKLSTPRPTDWEKVLPKKWREAKHLGRGKCGEYYVKGANRMLRDCFNAVKGLVRR